MEVPGFGEVDDQGEPDGGITCEFGGGEGFVEDENTEEQLDGGADVLQQTQCCEWDATGACGEKQQGNGGGGAAGDEELSVSGAAFHKPAFGMGANPEQIGEGEGE